MLAHVKKRHRTWFRNDELTRDTKPENMRIEKTLKTKRNSVSKASGRLDIDNKLVRKQKTIIIIDYSVKKQ